jgi:hypothetical protein
MYPGVKSIIQLISEIQDEGEKNAAKTEFLTATLRLASGATDFCQRKQVLISH